MELKLPRVLGHIQKLLSFNRTLWNWNFLGYLDIFKNYYAFNRTLWNWNSGRIISSSDEPNPFNRTLWNWNIRELTEGVTRRRLLIVPYGIETGNASMMNWPIRPFNRTLWNWNSPERFFLLGSLPFNRTLWNWNYASHGKETTSLFLLIVPYGIETLLNMSLCSVFRLLIVPYGIETASAFLFCTAPVIF